LLSEQEARDLAGAFLFSGQDQDKQLHVLSGGERARVSLASLLASAKNLLVLDEPTNHLDIPSSERLEEAMSPERGYDGAMLLISHDRALIDALCEHLIIFDGKGGVTVYHGTYSDWVESVQRRNDLAATGQQPATSWSQITSTNSSKSTTSKATQQTSNKGASKPPQQPSNTAASKQPASTAQPTRSTTTSYTPKPAPPKRKSKFSWMSVDQVEERMGELQAELVTIDEDLANAATWNNPARAEKASSRRDDIANELEQLEEEWLYRSAH
jgi:ATP-binding cassette, subfamily F, member 3